LVAKILFAGLFFLFLFGKLTAQESFFETAAIPLDSNITVTLTSKDAAAFDYYNMYNFQYLQGSEKLQAAFMVPKNTDKFTLLQKSKVKLCRVTSFVNSWKGIEGDPVPVEDYIEMPRADGKGKIHINLDPDLADPVYTICGTEKAVVKSKK